MSATVEFLARGVLMGLGASALMDAWALLARRAFGVQGLDYAMLGRWIGHLSRGRFFHDAIARSVSVRGERLIGWVAHYSIGVTFAFLLLATWGMDWARSPTFGPPMFVGLSTLLAPWLLMQPGMGAGIAASRTPRPAAARLRNLATHTVYGVGLYASAVMLSTLPI